MEINCGIEIEAEYNSKIMTINRAPHHPSGSNKIAFGKQFFVEIDGSLRALKFKDHPVPNDHPGRKELYGTAEFVSKMFPITKYKETLDDFKEMIITLGKSKTMSDLIHFNRTTGCHIHISLKDDNKHSFPLKDVKMSEYILFNKLLMGKVTEKLPHVGAHFCGRFYREHARKRNQQKARNSSWNFETAENNHVEFRSFHLMGVETWEDLYTMFDIVFNELSQLCQRIIKKGVTNNFIYKPEHVSNFESSRNFSPHLGENRFRRQISRNVNMILEVGSSA